MAEEHTMSQSKRLTVDILTAMQQVGLLRHWTDLLSYDVITTSPYSVATSSSTLIVFSEEVMRLPKFQHRPFSRYNFA